MDFEPAYRAENLDPLNDAVLATPIGKIRIIASERGIRELKIVRSKPKEAKVALLQNAVDQLEEYFEGQRREFFLPLDAEGTPFQVQVWSKLSEIPYGDTVSYADIAIQHGGKKVSQAVGAAIGANPLPIILPCHRVIASDGKLRGFAWGLERKRWLLDFEAWKVGKMLFKPVF